MPPGRGQARRRRGQLRGRPATCPPSIAFPGTSADASIRGITRFEAYAESASRQPLPAPSERIQVQPRWSALATVAVLLVGSGMSLWLLLEIGRRLIGRLGDHL